MMSHNRLTKLSARNLTRALRLLGPALFIVILLRVDLSAVALALITATPVYLLLAVAMHGPLFICKTQRWRMLLAMQDIEYAFGSALLAMLSGFYVSLITPGRVGDFIKVFYVREGRNVSWGKALSSVLVDRFCDLALIGAMGLAGAYLLPVGSENARLLWAGALLSLTLAAALLFNRRVMTRVLAWLADWRSHSGPAARLEFNLEEFLQGIEALRSPGLLWVGALTLLTNVAFFLSGYFIARSLGLPLDFGFVSFAMAVGTLVSLLPFSFSGVGVRDAALILLFARQGLRADQAVTFSLLLVLVLNVVAGLMGLVAWTIHPVSWERSTQQAREAP